jgi:hypothetical protein
MDCAETVLVANTECQKDRGIFTNTISLPSTNYLEKLSFTSCGISSMQFNSLIAWQQTKRVKHRRQPLMYATWNGGTKEPQHGCAHSIPWCIHIPFSRNNFRILSPCSDMLCGQKTIVKWVQRFIVGFQKLLGDLCDRHFLGATQISISSKPHEQSVQHCPTQKTIGIMVDYISF